MRYRMSYYFTNSGNHWVKIQRLWLLKPGTKAHDACLRADKEQTVIVPISDYGDIVVIQKMKWWELW